MRVARSITLSHHEKWDGSGYPNALRGEEIPIEGRITAVCDVFDALTSDRPYKAAWPVDKARCYVRDNAGSHFDPVLAEAFIDILPEILEIREAHADIEEAESATAVATR